VGYVERNIIVNLDEEEIRTFKILNETIRKLQEDNVELDEDNVINLTIKLTAKYGPVIAKKVIDCYKAIIEVGNEMVVLYDVDEDHIAQKEDDEVAYESDDQDTLLQLLAYSLKPGNFAIVKYTFLTEDPNIRELIEPYLVAVTEQGETIIENLRSQLDIGEFQLNLPKGISKKAINKAQEVAKELLDTLLL
jgi:hypothetical protein